ncbi:50S ribosomal protein L10 [Moheibacter sediminis]|uniref:Large ribosomal subunit protein uL10 n=1 Tax=Moheibacter sediminis TaxID=1434700 RepID=A0A1W1ZWH9_9FLAO|nr:50S ribosomal protein L10 [Moheibacter sediminis]SMC52481.1 LSU ribosomal protein L10P [Moheibacter sediminis]
MGMTKQQKAQMIDDLTAVLEVSNIVYLADISGLNASNTTELRRACHKGDISLRVVKNTLLQKAMERIEDKDFSGLYDSLAGNTALMIAEKGNAPAKVIETFRKKSDKPVLKGAWIESSVYVGDDKLAALSALKSREEMIADIVALLKSPIQSLVSQLQNKDNASKEEGTTEVAEETPAVEAAAETETPEATEAPAEEPSESADETPAGE